MHDLWEKIEVMGRIRTDWRHFPIYTDTRSESKALHQLNRCSFDLRTLIRNKSGIKKAFETVGTGIAGAIFQSILPDA